MRNILVLAPDMNDLVNSCFLLKLAGNRVTALTATDEALNFLLIREKVGQPFQCLLLTGEWNASALTPFLYELANTGLSLPVLFASREPMNNDDQAELMNSFKGLRFIHSENLLDEVQGL